MDDKRVNGFEKVIIFLSGIIVLLIGYLVYDIFFINMDIHNEKSFLNLANFSKYKNYDDTYAIMKSLEFVSEVGKKYSINIALDGSVYTGIYVNRKDIVNVTNAKDIIIFEASSGLIRDYKCYILTDDGNVYVYNLSDMLDGIYEATLLDNIINVEKILKLEYAKSLNASGSRVVVAVLEDGSVVELNSDNG